MILRFDIPDQDENGRWRQCLYNYYIGDGIDPLRATVKSIEVCVFDNVPFAHVQLEVEGDHTEEDKIEKLIEFYEYLQKLKRAEKIEVRDSDSGFSQSVINFLQNKRCVSVADVANMSISSFHEEEKNMVETIEKILKKRWGLMFAAGQG